MVRRALVPGLFVALAACDPRSLTQPLLDDGPVAARAADLATIALENGGMEEVSGWFTSEPAGYSAEYSSEFARTGTRSFKLSGNGSATFDAFGFVGQNIDVADLTGTRLTLSVHLRLEGVAGEGVAIAIRGDDTDAQNGFGRRFSTTKSRILIDGTADWMEYKVDLTEFDDSIDQIAVYVMLLPLTTGTVFVDDVTLTSSDGVIPGLQPFFQNLGFEAGGLDRGADYWRTSVSSGMNRTTSSFTFEVSDVVAFEGKRAASISSNEPSHGLATWSETIKADEFVGGPVTLRVRLRGSVVGPGLELRIRGHSASGSPVVASTQYRVRMTGSFDWDERSVTLPYLPPGTENLTIELTYLSSTKGTVYFDAVEVVGSR
jgi:hypothetical protein